MHAAILARVSSDSQHIDTQLAHMRAQAVRDGVTVVAEYVDDGISGASASFGARAGLKKMLADVARRPSPWSVLYVWDFDRLLRSDEPEEQAAIVGPLKRARTVVRDRNGEVPPLWTTVGRMVALLRLDGAAEWLEKHIDRIKAGKDRAISQHRKPAGPTPFGLAYDREKGEWSIDEPRAAIIREAFERVAGGESCTALATEFNMNGVLRAVRREKPTRNGAAPAPARPWTRERIYNLVTSKTYLGQWTADKRRRLVVPVPRIVSDELFHAAQTSLSRHKLRGLKRTRHVYLLEEIARCAVCGAPIGVSSASRVGRRPAYYICTRRRRPELGQKPCTLPMLRVDETDRRVWAAVADLLERPDHLDRALARRRADADGGAHDWEADLRGFESKLKKSIANEAALLERFDRGLISLAAMDENLKRMVKERRLLEQQIATARAQLAGARREQADVAVVRATMETLRTRLSNATPEVKRDLVRALVPGRGEHFARLSAKDIELSVVVAATAGEQAEAPAVAPAPIALRLVA